MIVECSRKISLVPRKIGSVVFPESILTRTERILNSYDTWVQLRFKLYLVFKIKLRLRLRLIYI